MKKTTISSIERASSLRKGANNYERASVLKGHDMLVKAIVNDGADTVVSGGWDGRVFAWKVRKGNQICLVEKNGNPGLSVSRFRERGLARASWAAGTT